MAMPEPTERRQNLPAAAWVVIAAVVLNGGWMVFDGAHALILGDYVTPSSGRFAGQLGPWSRIVEAAGIAPRSVLMKTIFVLYGVAYLAAMVAWARRVDGSRSVLIGLAALGLWHLPWGTLLNLIAIALLQLPSLRD